MKNILLCVLAVAVVALFLGLTVYFTASGDHFDQAKAIYQVQP